MTVKCFCGAGLRFNMLRIQGFLYMQVISTSSGISISYLTSYMPAFALCTFQIASRLPWIFIVHFHLARSGSLLAKYC